MAEEFRQFDYDSISDVILHIRYTARDGGSTLRDPAIEELQETVNNMVMGDDATGLQQSFSAEHNYPTEFYRFLHPPGDVSDHQITFDLAANRFPFMFRNRNIRINRVDVILKLHSEHTDANLLNLDFDLQHPGGEATVDFSGAVLIRNSRLVSVSDIDSSPGEWVLTSTSDAIDEQLLTDIGLIVHYAVS